jgi:hypothetical protein
MTDTDTSIEALAQQVAEYLRAHRLPRQLVNQAGELVGPGTYATGRLVVNPGDEIQSVWGNTTYDQTMQVFTSTADRDAQWTAPHDGALAYTLDTQTAWVRRAGVWGALRNAHGARCTRTTAFTFPATGGTLVYPFLFNAVTTDTEGNYSPATGLYTCPVDGWYMVTTSIMVNATAAGQALNMYLYRNGAQAKAIYLTSAGAQSIAGQVTDAYRYTAGDTIGTGAICSIASGAMRVGAAENGMSIAYQGV